jgi:hypothetical protein
MVPSRLQSFDDDLRALQVTPGVVARLKEEPQRLISVARVAAGTHDGGICALVQHVGRAVIVWYNDFH